MPGFVTGTMLFLTILIVLVTLGAYTANVISPEKIWHFAFAGLSFPFLLAAHALMMLCWLFVRPKYALISLFTLLAGFNITARHIQLRYPDEFDRNLTGMLHVTSYNARNFELWGDYGKPRYENLDLVVDHFRNHPSDILCIQEGVISNPRTGNIAEKIQGRLGFSGMASSRYTIGGSHGLIIFFNGKKLDSGIINHNGRAIAVHTDIETEAGRVRVYNVHLQSAKLGKEEHIMDRLTPDAYKDPEFVRSSKQIARNLKRAYLLRAQQADILHAHISSSPYPVILCGDLNDTPCSYAYTRVSKGLQDTFVKAGRGLGRTYHGKFPSFRIDYLFASKGIKVKSHQIGSLQIGDHHPVSSFLELSSQTD